MIEKDRPFGSLLCKIKQAYTDFLKEMQLDKSDGEGSIEQEQTIEKMQNLLQLTNEENAVFKKANSDLKTKQTALQTKLKEKDSMIKDISIDAEKLIGKNKQLQQTIE